MTNFTSDGLDGPTLSFSDAINHAKDALLHRKDDLDYFLGHDPSETPLAVQIGGHNPEFVGAAAKLCYEYGGFSEINLNVGCPSPTVSKNYFGARLMLDPNLVYRICSSMFRHTNSLPEITVKCRIGVDDHDSYTHLHNFVYTVAESGVNHFIVHARKCWLNGLSPHENRTIPVLNYDYVTRLKQDFPHLSFTLNGGVQSLQHAAQLLENEKIDGVMVGRAGYQSLWNFRDADRLIYGASNPNHSRREIIDTYVNYAEDIQERWGLKASTPCYIIPTMTLVKPLLSLFRNEVGGKIFKRSISDQWADKSANHAPRIRELVENALSNVPDKVLDVRVEDELELDSKAN